jgi:hypothetical protein
VLANYELLKQLEQLKLHELAELEPFITFVAATVQAAV